MNTTTSDYIAELKAKLEAAERQVAELQKQVKQGEEDCNSLEAQLYAMGDEREKLREQLAALTAVAKAAEEVRIILGPPNIATQLKPLADALTAARKVCTEI